MKVHHILICFSFLYLQDRKSGVNAQTSTYGGKGGSLTVRYVFDFPGTKKIFCRDECKKENILVETTSDSAQSGRYSIQHHYKYPSQYSDLSVTFTNLIKSDAGWYKCGLAPYSSYSYRDFQVIVADALLDEISNRQQLHTEAGGSVSVACSFSSSGRRSFLCNGDCQVHDILVETDGVRNESGRYRIQYEEQTFSGIIVFVAISQLEKSDSGWYRCSLEGNITSSYRDFQIFVKDAVVKPSTTETSRHSSVFPETSTQPGQTLDKGTDVLLIAGLSLAAVVILLSTVLLVFCKKRASRKVKEPAQETEYATVRKGEDSSSKLVYSEVQISNTKFKSRESSFPRNTEDVVYSMPRAAVSSREDQLYSNM